MEVLSSVCVEIKEVQAAMLAASPQTTSPNSSHKMNTQSASLMTSHALCKAKVEALVQASGDMVYCTQAQDARHTPVCLDERLRVGAGDLA